MKLNFWPFHKHQIKLIRWRLVHQPHYEPSRRAFRMKCKGCGKEWNYFPMPERDTEWENANRHLQGYWFGNEKKLED